MSNITKVVFVVISIFYLSNCGFKPIYKLSENNFDFRNYSVKIFNESNTSREAREEIKRSFPSSSKTGENYIIEISLVENLDPLITNTDGTVAKYRIEIIMDFKVKDKNESMYLMDDFVRGFAQYTVETSEIESEDKKKRMTRMATSSAIQMMISKIQSDVAISNGN